MRDTKRKKRVKIVAKLLCFIMIFTSVCVPQYSIHATQNRMGNYSTSFSLSGNGADDIVSVAKAQIGRTGSQLGYSEEWCADFVSDCAALANQGSAIPRDGYCPNLQTAIVKAGGQPVSISSARKGDIAFYGTNGASHVEIIYANNGGRISSIGGNSGNWSDCYSRRVRDHSYQTMTITKVLRPNYGSKPAVLPGTIDSGWKVPVNVTASHRITTYDQWANPESNHYIDPGDSCYITEVYTNGFVKVQYPVSGGKRWAYAKASDFSLEPPNSLPETKLQAWFSSSAMGGTVNSIRLNDSVYLCYRLETQDGKLLDESIGNYTVKETIFFPDGSTFPYSYGKSNNNWIRSDFTQWGTYRGVVEISGDYTGKVEVSYTISKPKDILLSSWFSSSKMGSEVSAMEKGKFYYLCYSIKGDNDYLNKIANCDYSVTEEVYGPDGKKVHTYTYEKSDNNWIGFTATQSGTYKGIVTVKGHPSGSTNTTCICKDTSTPKLESISIVQYPNKLDYELGTALDLRGMVVKACYSNKTYKTITNYRVSGDMTKVGHPVITISYTEGGITKTAQFKVNVKEKTPQTVTITYNSCGGNWEQKQQQVKKGEKTTLLSGTPGKTYKVTLDANGGVLSQTTLSADALFLGWYTQRGGKGQRYSPGESVSFNQNVTLYAAYGSAKIGTLPVPSRNACEFDGWYMANGTKVSSNTMISDDCTLTAKWQLKEPVHQAGDWIVVQMPTNTSPGKKVKKCQDCGLIMETEIIPMLQEDNNGQIDDQDPDEPDDNDEEVETVALGDEITTDEAIYTVTKLGDTPCVEYSELFDDEVTQEIIPDTITVDGVTYLVTSVGTKAFYKNTDLNQVTIGRNISEIGSKAFYGCSSLSKIIIKSDKLKSGSIGSQAFTRGAKNVKVYVPGTKYSTYKKVLKKAGIGSKAKIYKKK